MSTERYIVVMRQEGYPDAYYVDAAAPAGQVAGQWTRDRGKATRFSKWGADIVVERERRWHADINAGATFITQLADPPQTENDAAIAAINETLADIEKDIAKLARQRDVLLNARRHYEAMKGVAA